MLIVLLLKHNNMTVDQFGLRLDPEAEAHYLVNSRMLQMQSMSEALYVAPGNGNSRILFAIVGIWRLHTALPNPYYIDLDPARSRCMSHAPRVPQVPNRAQKN